MLSKTLHFLAPRALLALATAASLASPWAQAQQVYRIVGPDGKVTFSDRAPPPSVSNAKVSEAGASAAAADTVSAALPFELRQVALKYPVTLYAGDSCAPCGAARSMLTSRGIPFREMTIATAADTQALQRLSGEASLPFLTLGSQQLKGFSEAEWTQYLNAAGYPATSALPASYRAPAPTPLVSVAPAPAATTGQAPTTTAPSVTARPARPARPAAQQQPDSSNPAGIKF